MSDPDDRPEATSDGLPVAAQDGPYAVQVEEGKLYRWCSCGLSRTQPWCDDSHVGTRFQPIEFVAPITETFFMCGCKATENPPYCFGTCRGYRRTRGDGPAI